VILLPGLQTAWVIRLLYRLDWNVHWNMSTENRQELTTNLGMWSYGSGLVEGDKS
jgi:hypothetical protein